MIKQLLIIGLLLELVLGLKKKANALLICFCLISLIPAGAIKYNVGFNLNSFNLSIFVIFVITVPLLFRNKRSLYPRITKIMMLYVFFVFFTSLFSYIYSFPISEFFQNMVLFLLEYTILGMCLCHIRLDGKDINRFCYVLLFLCVIIVSYAFVNYIIKFNPYIAYLNLVGDLEDMSNSFMNEERGFLEGRVSSVFQHPLHLGQFILLAFSFLYYELRARTHLFLYIVILTFLLITVVLTGSRSALVPIIIIPFIEKLYQKKTILIRYVCLGCVSLFLAYPLIPSTYRDNIKGILFFWDDEASSRADIHGSSVESRTGQLNEAILIIQDDILLGKGSGYVKNHGADHAEMLGYESIFLSKLIEGGVVGLIVFIWFYFALYRVMLKKCGKNKLFKARTHSLCLPFFISRSMTGISYSFFTIYIIFYFYTLSIISKNSNIVYDSQNSPLLLVKR